MSGFSTDWLDLREAADHRARDAELARAAAAILDDRADPLVVDLGSGTGSTVRALAPLMARPPRWRLVDHDPALLAEAAARCGGGVETVVADLAALGPLPIAGADLVTASALFDLASATFVERVVATAASHRSAVYAALSYDGTTAWGVPHGLDDEVLAAFNRDQRRDKGFGPALGPDAGQVLSATLERAGYRVRTAESPWRLGPDDGALAAALAEGIAAAVAGSLDEAALDDWLAFRLARAGEGETLVGHLDVLAVPG